MVRKMEKIFSGSAPLNDGTDLITLKEPKENYPIPMAPDCPEEFAPGLDPELQELADAFSEFKEKMLSPKKAALSKKTSAKK